jgi:hypothetical protein
MSDASSLFTTVKNPTAGSRTYGYLGYHGKTLPAAAEYTWFGSMIDYAAAGKPTHKRWTDAIQRDLIAKNLVIIRTPRPIMKDFSTLAIKALSLSGGALGVVDPSYGAYVD